MNKLLLLLPVMFMLVVSVSGCTDVIDSFFDALGGGGNGQLPIPPGQLPPSPPGAQPQPAPEPAAPASCSDQCTGQGYDFGIDHTTMCGYPFSLVIPQDGGGYCCCGEVEFWPGSSWSGIGTDSFCFDSDGGHTYDIAGFCASSSNSLVDYCETPSDFETVKEAVCDGNTCTYGSAGCSLFPQWSSCVMLPLGGHCVGI